MREKKWRATDSRGAWCCNAQDRCAGHDRSPAYLPLPGEGYAFSRNYGYWWEPRQS